MPETATVTATTSPTISVDVVSGDDREVQKRTQNETGKRKNVRDFGECEIENRPRIRIIKEHIEAVQGILRVIFSKQITVSYF